MFILCSSRWGILLQPWLICCVQALHHLRLAGLRHRPARRLCSFWSPRRQLAACTRICSRRSCATLPSQSQQPVASCGRTCVARGRLCESFVTRASLRQEPEMLVPSTMQCQAIHARSFVPCQVRCKCSVGHLHWLLRQAHGAPPLSRLGVSSDV